MITLKPETNTQVQLLVAQNRKIEAIKLVHDTAKCGLKEAKDYVDRLSGGGPEQMPDKELFNGADLDAQLRALLAEGKKINAVKLYNDFTGAGLAESKYYVDGLQEKATYTGTGSDFRSHETQIDKLLGQSDSKAIISRTPGTSSGRIFFIVFIIAVVIGLLMYLLGNKH